MGRRLGEKTRENTKCMVEVNGVKLIDRLLGQLSQLGLSRVIIVVGYQGQRLVDYIGHRYDGKLRIEYAENPIYDRTNNIYSLSLVKEQMQEDDTLLIESDLIFSDRLFPMIMENPYPNLALVAKYETWMDGTMVRIDQENNIVNFVPKQAFKYEDVEYYYKTVNIYKFSREFSRQKYVPFLEAYCHALGNNEYYEQVLRVITLLDNAELKAVPIGSEKWYEIDDIQDLDIAETIFAEDDEMLRRFNYRYGGHWRFPKMLDYCYLVNPYFPTKRMKDELRYNFDTLLTEYPSGMLVNSLLAGKYFGIRQDYVVVGNGAAELIKSLMELSEGRTGVIYPTFEEYPHRLRKDDIVAFQPDNCDLKYTEDDLIGYFTGKGIERLLLINPDNPSGNFIGMEGLQKLIDWSREQHITLIVDESFVDFSDDIENNNLVRNVTFDNIRIEQIEAGCILQVKVGWNQKYCKAPGLGIEDVTFRNIRYKTLSPLPRDGEGLTTFDCCAQPSPLHSSSVKRPLGPSDGRGSGVGLSIINGYNEERKVRNITFEGLKINGRAIYDDMLGKPRWYQTADYVPMYVGNHVEGLTFKK